MEVMSKTGVENNVNAQSVSYKIGHTGKKAVNGQIRITAISVTYKQQ